MKDFTCQDLRNEILELRSLMGTKDFWAKSSEHRERALKGLGHMYFTYDSKNMSEYEIQQLANQYMSILGEYQRRELMVLRLAIRQ